MRGRIERVTPAGTVRAERVLVDGVWHLRSSMFGYRPPEDTGTLCQSRPGRWPVPTLGDACHACVRVAVILAGGEVSHEPWLERCTTCRRGVA